ncbi:Coenzyme F420 hydrogenase/dehydrogenase, beta subunit C-terminal domain [uncultured Alistipes sp.]|jgi:hypothetical protein|uniref:Coenzyme F420 hydrogenase/dehydrogenase, beta subunit C-terminal domain n=1 Tax=uncultured Alistipes sp. TaxID=538949 RepID=UPI0025FFE3F3|nr:Coenzyme F420 hydrogenase/dehydrogenase, beta subunit C-terminal domain [uncultured Alistipes sp.]
MIEITDKQECCGCWGCANVCPKQCISMVADAEGFLYPVVDKDICIQCGLCEKVCPIIHATSDVEKPQKAYLLQIKDDRIRRESTSGGAFTAIGAWVIEQGGVVFGAAFDDDFVVRHRSARTFDELGVYRNSKYVQSRIGETFREAKKLLDAGTLVCFSGTPCQIEGLLGYLRKPYDNLILVDLVCRAVPSPLVLSKYLEVQRKIIGGKFENVLFRDKHYGYKYSTFSIYNSQKEKNYHTGVDKDVYLRAFFANISPRPSCFSCRFKKRYRLSDFTLWDCFDVSRFNKEFDDDKGTTRILTHTARAEAILQEIEPIVKLCEIPVEKAVEGVRELIQVVPCNVRREAFFNDLNAMEPEACFAKYFPVTLKVRLEHALRLASHRLGIYQFVKKVYKVFFKNKANQKS